MYREGTRSNVRKIDYICVHADQPLPQHDQPWKLHVLPQGTGCLGESVRLGRCQRHPPGLSVVQLPSDAVRCPRSCQNILLSSEEFNEELQDSGRHYSRMLHVLPHSCFESQNTIPFLHVKTALIPRPVLPHLPFPGSIQQSDLHFLGDAETQLSLGTL